MKASGPYVFHPFVHLKGDLCYLAYGLWCKNESYAFCRQQRLVLCDEGVFRLCEYAPEILLCKRVQFHPDGKPALKLRQKIRGLGDMEGAACYKQHVISTNYTVFGMDRRTFNNWQEIALHSLS